MKKVITGCICCIWECWFSGRV